MITRRCRCGAGLHAHPTPGGDVDRVVAQFDRRHRGDGCGPVEPTEPDPTTLERP